MRILFLSDKCNVSISGGNRFVEIPIDDLNPVGAFGAVTADVEIALVLLKFYRDAQRQIGEHDTDCNHRAGPKGKLP